MDIPKYIHDKFDISGLNNDVYHNEDVLAELKKKNDYNIIQANCNCTSVGIYIIFVR